MDIIKLKGLNFYGYIGVLSEENQLGQKFILDIELKLPLDQAGKSDDVNDTVSYAEVYEVVKKIMENKKYNLIEKAGKEIIDKIFSEFGKVKKIKIEIKKPQAPVKGSFDYFSICLERKRDE
ncbi:MAG: dihydroneopterin aldolase [Bacillota bacterium]